VLNLIFRPVDKWPREKTPAASRRSKYSFKASFNSTLDLLEHELKMLEAHDAVIQGYFRHDQIRNDGWPYNAASPSEPGIILTFYDDLDEGFSYACDTYQLWQHNLRAIGLSLEALRAVDRYGTTSRGEQYQGFKALPPPADVPREMRPEEAAAFLASKIPGVDPQFLASEKQLFDMTFKLAQRRLHPDAGGAVEEFQKLQEAGRVLTTHFNDHAAGAAR
jgi:hypothetical protein